MITVTNLQWPDETFDRSDRAFGRSGPTLVAFDVEWTKNFRIKNGNVPFCYSYVFMRIPESETVLDAEPVDFGFKSVYVSDGCETQALIQAADQDMERVLRHAKVVTGHQLSSDLSVLLSAAEVRPEHIARAKSLWEGRKRPKSLLDPDTPDFFDTRYDMDDVFQCESRRLVDVCTEVGLDVFQPEITGSMTAMHRAYLQKGDQTIRERISVLNIRHSFSQALLAFYGLRKYRWEEKVSVNKILYDALWDCFDYLENDPLWKGL